MNASAPHGLCPHILFLIGSQQGRVCLLVKKSFGSRILYWKSWRTSVSVSAADWEESASAR